MTTLVSDLIGLTEIADMYRVSKNTANGWTKKPDFPAPKHRLAMGPMWDKGEVQQWMRPNNFPQELILHCAHCQSRAVAQQDPNPSALSALICASCGGITWLSLQVHDDHRLHFSTTKGDF